MNFFFKTIIFSILTTLIQNFQFSLPNFGLLQMTGILDKDLKLSNQAIIDTKVTSKDFKRQNNFQEALDPCYFKLFFQMFVYPYRVYSYFDQTHRKQYLFIKINKQEELSKDNNKNGQLFEPASSFQIISAQIKAENIQRCLNGIINPEQNDCLSRYQLFDLFPDFLTIVQMDHDRISLQKITQNRILLKNSHQQRTNTHQVKFYKIFSLIELNFHAFIYQARIEFLKILHSYVYPDSEKMIKQKTDDLKPASVKVLQYFSNKRQLELRVYKNYSIFQILFTHNSKIEIQEDEIYSYTHSADTFYLTSTRQAECPEFSKTGYGMFSSIMAEKFAVEKCTYLKINQISFNELRISDPIEYISKDQRLSNVSYVSIRHDRQETLSISLVNLNSSLEIKYGENWKRISRIQLKQKIFGVIYLQNRKVIFTDKQASIYENQEQKVCSFPLLPYFLTFNRIHNNLFSSCVEGSVCYLIDQNCRQIGKMIFDNALGLQWQYKINPNFLDDQFNYESYLQVSRIRGDIVRELYQVPFDLCYLKEASVNAFPQFPLEKYYVNHLKDFEYQVRQALIEPLPSQESVLFSGKSQRFQINLPKIFKSKVYRVPNEFRTLHLEYLLSNTLSRKIQQYFAPKPFANKTQLKKNLFNGCVFNEFQNIIRFKQNWNMCRVTISPNQRMIIEPLEKPQKEKFETRNNAQEPSLPQQQVNKNNTNKNEDQMIFPIYLQASFVDLLDGLKNQIIVCQLYQDSSPTSKCKITQFELDAKFTENSKQLKLGLELNRYYQIYFFRNEYVIKNNKSSVKKIKTATLESFNETSIKQKQTNITFKAVFIRDLPKFFHDNQRKMKTYDIQLRDIDKEQLQYFSRILVIGYFIFLPVITMCCCIICFRTYIKNTMIFYGIIRSQPTFRYPLNPLALKIKMKQLQKKGYVKTLKESESSQSLSDSQTFSQQCSSSSGDAVTISGLDCCFCLQNVDLNQEITELYCKHQFHFQCFTEWVKNEPNLKCPFCRRQFTKSALRQFVDERNVSIVEKQQIQNSDGQSQAQNQLSEIGISIEFQN